IPALQSSGIQVIWQCGSYYYQELRTELEDTLPESIKLMPFLERMDYAYAACDIIVARAGAGTISELCAIGKPVVLVPSPNVADDHQTKNANALVQNHAAIMVKDALSRENLVPTVLDLFQNEAKQKDLSENIRLLALANADEVIAQ